MDEGDSIGGNPVICGLDEHPATGRLIIPRKSQQAREFAIEAAGLTEREWQIWRLHCRNNSHARIGTKLGIDKSNVCRSLLAIESKINAARERTKKHCAKLSSQMQRKPWLMRFLRITRTKYRGKCFPECNKSRRGFTQSQSGASGLQNQPSSRGAKPCLCYSMEK